MNENPTRRYPRYDRNDILTSEEAAVVLGCETTSALSKYKDKGLPYFKPGVKCLYIYGQIVDWLINSCDCTNGNRIALEAESRCNATSIIKQFKESARRKAKKS